MFRQFAPALRFIAIFLGVYLVANALYGVYIESLGAQPDFFTRLVTTLTAGLLNFLGAGPVAVVANPGGPTFYLQEGGKTVLNIFEGCNGLNVLIVYNAFLLGYGNHHPRRWWLVVGGNLLIYVANIIRLLLLFWVAVDFHQIFYYVHKYLFTAAIYAVVFALWFFWIRMSEIIVGKHA